MKDQTPAELARKFGAMPFAVKAAQPAAISARALVTKRTIVAAAQRRTRKASGRWVQFKIVDGVAAVRLRGGLAYLTELGSHIHEQGWEETPRKAGAILTPEGPRATVMHPALRPRPFWDAAVEASRKPGRDAYQKVVDRAILQTLR